MAAAKLKPIDHGPVEEMSRRALAEELVGYHRTHRAMFERIDGLKARLKQLATEAGENFKEEFAGLGAVNVVSAKEPQYKGDLPVLDCETFNALTKSKKDRLIADGLVKIEGQYSGRSYGSVTVKLF
ncbi:MAG: hypothetical protein HXY30_14865 [Pseudorhodoplanes sp.]|nr:hypothetical protein [Pseudorhodoplanes sp.]